MNKHYKKPKVYPETAREWLRRYESGEALKAIALKDHFDIRTVKRQVEEAISDRNIKEVRQTVLRAALEKHFNDFVTLSEKMRGMVAASSPIDLDPDSTLLLDGLKQHLPRAPLWDCLAKYEEKLIIVECKNAEEGKVKNVGQSRAGVREKRLEGFRDEMIDNTTTSISDFQIQEKSQESANSDSDSHITPNHSFNVDRRIFKASLSDKSKKAMQGSKI